jgi:thiol-disulfide isomerase/thioredoxin
MRRHFLLAILLAVLCAGCTEVTIDLPGQEPATAPVVTPGPGEPEPDFGPEPEFTREVLFFTQRGCPPCESAKPDVAKLRREGVKVTEIDVRVNPELARRYQITRTPTFVVLEGGVEVERTTSIALLITILVKVLAWILPFLLG